MPDIQKLTMQMTPAVMGLIVWGETNQKEAIIIRCTKCCYGRDTAGHVNTEKQSLNPAQGVSVVGGDTRAESEGPRVTRAVG